MAEKISELRSTYSVFSSKTWFVADTVVCAQWLLPTSFFAKGTGFAYILNSQMFSREWTSYGLRVYLNWSAPIEGNPFSLPLASIGMALWLEGKSSMVPLERDKRKEACLWSWNTACEDIFAATAAAILWPWGCRALAIIAKTGSRCYCPVSKLISLLTTLTLTFLQYKTMNFPFCVGHFSLILCYLQVNYPILYFLLRSIKQTI